MSFRRIIAALALIVIGLTVFATAASGQASQTIPPPTSAPSITSPTGVPITAPVTTAPVVTTTIAPIGVFGGEDFGGPPIDTYRVKGNDSPLHPVASAQTMVVSFLYGAATWSTQTAIIGIRWSWRYDIAHALEPAVEGISKVTDQHLVARWNLRHIALLLTALYAGFLFMRGKVVAGVGEILMSVVCLILVSQIALNPAGFYRTATGVVQEASSGIVGSPNDLTNGLRGAMVNDTWEWLNFGRVVHDTPCKPAIEEALKNKDGGPAGSGVAADVINGAAKIVTHDPNMSLSTDSSSEDKTDSVLKEHNCNAEADYYGSTGFGKVIGALFVFIASVIIALMVWSIALSIMIVQIVFALLAITAPMAAVAAAWPGQGRDFFFRWCAMGIKAGAVAIAGVYLLVLLLLTITGVLNLPTSAGLGMEYRLFLVAAIALMAFRYRKHIAGSAARASGKLATKAAMLSPAADSVISGKSVAAAGAGALGALGANPDVSRMRALNHARGTAVNKVNAAANTKAGQGASAVTREIGRGTRQLARGGYVAAAGTVARAAARYAGGRGGVDTAGDEPEGVEIRALGSGFRGELNAGPQGVHYGSGARPGDAPPRFGTLGAARAMAALNAGPPVRVGSPVPDVGSDPSDPLYDEDRLSRNTTRLTAGSQREQAWTERTQQRLLRIHEDFATEGRGPLQPGEIDPSVPPSRAKRIAERSAGLFADQTAATHLAGRGLLKIASQSAEERKWVSSANFFDPSDFTKLERYREEGRLRFKGARGGPFPADKSIAEYAQSKLGDRPIDVVSSEVKAGVR